MKKLLLLSAFFNLSALATHELTFDRITNTSVRIYTGAEASKALNSGFIVSGNEYDLKTFVIRVLGPDLYVQAPGLPDIAYNPWMRINQFDQEDQRFYPIYESDNWVNEDQFTQDVLELTGLNRSANSFYYLNYREAVKVITVRPGSYTVEAFAKSFYGNAENAQVLLEIFDVDYLFENQGFSGQALLKAAQNEEQKHQDQLADYIPTDTFPGCNQIDYDQLTLTPETGASREAAAQRLIPYQDSYVFKNKLSRAVLPIKKPDTSGARK